MRVSISNIAWEVVEDPKVASLLNRMGVDAIDIAPGKYFREPADTTSADIHKVKDWWLQHGIEIVGMQALLFGTQGLNIFGSVQSQQAMLRHLEAVCRIAGSLGAKNLVFGSPKNRDCTGFSIEEAENIAVSFFQKLGDIASNFGVVICLEPNPTYYGANFMTTCHDTARIVNLTHHDAVKMQLDTGALSINKENAELVLESYADLIGHIHLSEQDLVPLGQNDIDYQSLTKTIKKYLPDHIATIETVAPKHEPHLVAMERSLKLVLGNFEN